MRLLPFQTLPQRLNLLGVLGRKVCFDFLDMFVFVLGVL